MSDSLWPHGLQHARPPSPSPTPGVHPDSRPSSQWCHPAISSSVVPFLPRIPPSIRVFSNESTLHMRWPNTGVSALASFLPKNTQDWSPLGWTGWISLQSKGFSRVFSNTTVQVATQVSRSELWATNHTCSEPPITTTPLPSSRPQPSMSLIPRQTLLIFEAQLKQMLLWQSDSLSFNSS